MPGATLSTWCAWTTSKRSWSPTHGSTRSSCSAHTPGERRGRAAISISAISAPAEDAPSDLDVAELVRFARDTEGYRVGVSSEAHLHLSTALLLCSSASILFPTSRRHGARRCNGSGDQFSDGRAARPCARPSWPRHHGGTTARHTSDGAHHQQEPRVRLPSIHDPAAGVIPSHRARRTGEGRRRPQCSAST